MFVKKGPRFLLPGYWRAAGGFSVFLFVDFFVFLVFHTFLYISNGFLVVFLWCSCFPMVFLRFSSGLPMVVLRFPMVFLSFSNGFL